MIDKNMKDTISKCSKKITGPVILDFIYWILNEALQRNIKTLYFMARDGYILHKTATFIVNKFGLPITCKYLYCSRNSLRIPSYHFIGEEAFDLLSLGGYHVTVNSLLKRALVSEKVKQEILREIKQEHIDCNKVMLTSELINFTKRLKESKTYRTAVYEVSKDAYSDTIGYLKQEGLLEQEVIAIVDSGWTGSVQRSLRQLLESAGFAGTLVGFYFGLYVRPKDPQDGIYLTWYFNKSGRMLDKMLFCNNLFECILSAPHGMTLSYERRNGKYVPVLAAEPQADVAELIATQIIGIMDYVTTGMSDFSASFDKKLALKTTRKRLHRFMSRPTREEAIAYGRFLFDDDVNDDEKTYLASEKQVALLPDYFIFARMIRKIKGNGKGIRELFWPYGTIALLPEWKRPWYRWNIYIWEWIKEIRYSL